MNQKHIVKKFRNYLRWPTDQWPLLLQSVLKEKAQEAYTALPISECVDYNCLKNAILKAYELWYHYYYYVFILSAISPYTTGVKAQNNQSNCIGTAPTHK